MHFSNPALYRAARSLARAVVPNRLLRWPTFHRLIERIIKHWLGYVEGGLQEAVTLTIGGARLQVPRQLARQYYLVEYEPVTRKAFLECLREGAVVVDVGAHVGLYTVLAGRRVGLAGCVHAVEPAEDNLAYLRRNIILNRLQNVRIHPVAAGSRRRKRAFHLTSSSDSHGFYEHPYAQTRTKVEVEEVALSELISGKIDVLKIDVEGAELDALEGLMPLLTQSHLTVCVEWNPSCMRKAGHDPMELPLRLRELGFESMRVLDDLQGCTRPFEEVAALVAKNDTPHFWYVNLWATRD